jgi:hypothetical protein|tara:strand:+ start:263 stop:994 length:732 start_codon:yes stop_codon:yes gene_type:complete
MDDPLREEGDPDPIELADDELLDSDDTYPSVDDDTIDSEPPEEKTVPYTRFKDVNDRLKDVEAKYQAATKPKEPEPKDPPAERYSQKQIDTVQQLAGTKEMQDRIDEQDRRWEEKEAKDQKDADIRDRKAVVANKELNPNGFKEAQVQKQVQKWSDSSDPDKRWLALASYERVITEMNTLYKAKGSNKKDPPPKVDKGSAAATTEVRNPDVAENPNANNPLKAMDSLKREAAEYMKAMEGGDE